MRKKLAIAAAIILLLLLSFIGVLRYRQYSSYKVPVHAGAQTIIKVNADDFLKMFVSNYGINFKKKITNNEKKAKEPSINTGIWLPGNLFIYNLSSLKPATLFCTLPVFNQQDFILFAQKKWKLLFVKKDGIYFGNNQAGTLNVACNKDYISFAWSPAKENVQSYLKEILSSKNLGEQHAAVAARLKEQHLPLAAINGNNVFSLNFNGNQLLLHALLDSVSGFALPANFQQRSYAADTHSYFSFNGILSPSLFKKEYNIKQYKLATDSILPYFQGYLDLQLGPNSIQKDSISTYEYDDNFEKVAKLTVTDVQVPSLQLSVNALPGLLQYLKRQQIISAGMQLNPEVFPLYQVGVRQQDAELQFSTSGNSVKQVFTGSGNFLALKLDVEKIAAQVNLSLLEEYIKNILQLEMQGTRKQDKMIIEGKLLFKGSAIKEVISIAKTFYQQK